MKARGSVREPSVDASAAWKSARGRKGSKEGGGSGRQGCVRGREQDVRAAGRGKAGWQQQSGACRPSLRCHPSCTPTPPSTFVCFVRCDRLPQRRRQPRDAQPLAHSAGHRARVRGHWLRQPQALLDAHEAGNCRSGGGGEEAGSRGGGSLQQPQVLLDAHRAGNGRQGSREGREQRGRWDLRYRAASLR